MGAIPGIDILTMGIQGAAVYVGGELAMRSIVPRKNSIPIIRFFKFILGFGIAVKSALFLTFHARSLTF